MTKTKNITPIPGKNYKRTKRLFGNAKFYYILAGIFFICAMIAHPWDNQYKDFILSHRFLDHPILGTFLGLIKVFGNGGIAAVIALIIAAYGYKKLAYRIAISLIIMGIMVNILKPIAGRERPNNRNNHSFPSGDTATAAAFFPPMAAESNIFIPASVVLVPAVGFLRTYDNWHWLSDVITGMGVGFLAAGFALQFCRRKNLLFKLICRRLKPRYYAIISLIVLLSCFIPELITGGGKYLTFTAFYAPSLYVWLAACYIPFLFRNRSNQCWPTWKPILRLKQNFCPTSAKAQNSNKLHNTVLMVFLLILAFVLIIPPWIYNIPCLPEASTGIGIGILVLLLAVYKIKKRGIYKQIKPTVYFGICVLLVFIFISLLPAYIRNQTFYTENPKISKQFLFITLIK